MYNRSQTFFNIITVVYQSVVSNRFAIYLIQTFILYFLIQILIIHCFNIQICLSNTFERHRVKEIISNCRREHIANRDGRNVLTVFSICRSVKSELSENICCRAVKRYCWQALAEELRHLSSEMLVRNSCTGEVSSGSQRS